jgi:formylglycine-generating enzyme required for sulfatase activity
MVLELSQGVSGALRKCLVILIGCLLGIGFRPWQPEDLLAQTRARDMRVAASGEVTQLPERSKRYALIVGVDRYQDPQVTPLVGAGNDARSLRAALTRYGGFPDDHVILLTSDQPAGSQPTRGVILRKLSNLRAVVPKDGLLLFSFAGHGIQREGRAYLLASDSQVNGDLDLLEDTAINVSSQVRDRVEETGIGQVIFILDACRNEPGSGRSGTDNPLSEGFVKQFSFDSRNRDVSAFVILYASEIGHRAYEYVEKKQGYFSWFLVEALRGAAANERGEVTLGGVIDYLQEKVPQRVALDLGKGKAQKPFAVIEGFKANDLVLSFVPQMTRVTQNLPVGRGENLPQPQLPPVTQKPAKPAEVRPSVPKVAPARLQTFQFETISVDSAGRVVNQREAKADYFAEPNIGLEMVSIPGGTYPMGLGRSELALMGSQPVARSLSLDPIETMQPQRFVSLDSFFISRYEVTQAQWQIVSNLPKVGRELSRDPSYIKGNQLPVDQVSWEDANEFCNRLTRSTGRRYRLPTEAEWEYACRAGTTSLFHFGDKLAPDLANYRVSSVDAMAGPTPVGSKGVANRFGLFDMHGNVQEWCLDTWHANYAGAPSDGRAWEGGDANSRVLRGGAWTSEAVACASAVRVKGSVTLRARSVGFRVVTTQR